MVKRKVIQYTMDMVPVRTWDSIKEAQENYHISHISGVCRRKRKSDGGFVWRYEEPLPSRAESRMQQEETSARGHGRRAVREYLPHTGERPGTMADLSANLRRRN